MYDDEGGYTMPQRPDNILHCKGDPKFESGVVTGSKVGRNKKGVPNISLLQTYKDEIIPMLQDKLVNKYWLNDAGEERQVCIVLQEDGAGPHNEKKYNKWI